MSLFKKYAIPLSFFSIAVVFLLHKIPLSNFLLVYTTEYQANLLEDVFINSLILVLILFFISWAHIPMGLVNTHLSLFPYYLPLLFFILVFSGGVSGLLSSQLNFLSLDFIFFAIETLSSALLEEFLFKGLITGLLLLKYWDSKNGILKVATYASLLFGSTHVLNFWSQEGLPAKSIVNQIFATSCLGFMMCVIYLKTRNIMILVAAHFINNLLAGLPFVGETEILQQYIQSEEFTFNTILEEFFRLLIFGAPLLVGLLICNRITNDDIKCLLTKSRRV